MENENLKCDNCGEKTTLHGYALVYWAKKRGRMTQKDRMIFCTDCGQNIIDLIDENIEWRG